jgi:hypothetical protein
VDLIRGRSRGHIEVEILTRQNTELVGVSHDRVGLPDGADPPVRVARQILLGDRLRLDRSGLRRAIALRLTSSVIRTMAPEVIREGESARCRAEYARRRAEHHPPVRAAPPVTVARFSVFARSVHGAIILHSGERSRNAHDTVA